MDEFPISALFLVLGALILLSAVFSSSETGMMSLNRYKLKHQAQNGHKGAKKASMLLAQPERLISVILIGNNLVNIAAASLATIIAMRVWPEQPELALTVSTFALTMIVLIFAEVTPKTIAQRKPERIAFPASYFLQPLLVILYPAVWLINHVVSILLWLLRINQHAGQNDAVNSEELKSIVNESKETIPEERKNMLLGILELENVTVDDIMIPRAEVIGINLDDDVLTIQKQLRETHYTRLPIFKGELDKLVGVLHVRESAGFMFSEKPSKVMLTKAASDAYYVPENTALNRQLFNFQNQKKRMAFVVDEYGDVQGIVTLEDILEEIVGEFTRDILVNSKDIHLQADGSHVVDGGASIRDINKHLKWSLPTDGAKTLNGLIVERLESIPDANLCLKFDDGIIEVLQIKDNYITTARLRTFNQQRQLNLK